MGLEQRLHRAHLLCLGLETKSLLALLFHSWSAAPRLQCCSCGVPTGSAVFPKLLFTITGCPVALWVLTGLELLSTGVWVSVEGNAELCCRAAGGKRDREGG